MHSLSKLIKKDLIINLPKLNFEKDKICNAYQLDKQTRVSFKSKNIISTAKPLELLHMDLFGPTKTTCLDGKRYGFVIINDFFDLHGFYCIWIFSAFAKFYRKVSMKKSLSILKIRSDYGTEFEN